MDFKNKVLFFILIVVFIFSVGRIAFAEPESNPLIIKNFELGCKNNKATPFEITGYNEKTILVCKTYARDGGISLWANDGFDYILRGDNYFIVEQLTEPCDDGRPYCVILKGKNEHPIPQKPVISAQIIPIDNAIRSWINLTNSERPSSQNTTKSIQESKMEPACEQTSRLIPSSIKYCGLVNACIHDLKLDVWVDEDGLLYQHDQYDNFIDITPIEEKPCSAPSQTVMQRNNCNYGKLIDYERQRAINAFNASSILKQAALPDQPEYKDNRLYDCAGNRVSSKYLECKTKMRMELEQQKAFNLFDPKSIEKKIQPAFSHLYHDTWPRKKFMIENNMMWIWGQYNE